MSKQLFLALEKIRDDGNTQSRVGLDWETVEDYAERMGDPDSPVEFPPLVVFHDGSCYWLAEGFHRLEAMRQLRRSHALCVVHQGGPREARLHAAGSNARHGLRRSRADEIRSVHLLLADDEANRWPDEKIASHCSVSLRLVRALRISTPWQPPEGLFGPDDLAKPPAPDYAREDRESTQERARRAARKFLRFCDQLEVEPGVLLQEVAAEQAERARKASKKAEVEQPGKATGVPA